MWAAIQDRLSLCHGTMITISPPEFVTAAADAGFKRVSLRVLAPKISTMETTIGDYPLRGDTAMRRETRRRLDNAGLKVVEAEAALLLPETDVTEFESYVESSAFFDAVGVIPVFFGHTSAQQVLDQYAEFAALAARYGQQALIEFMPLSAIKTIGAAEQIIKKAGVSNGRIIVDSLHWTRSGGTVEDIRAINPALIHGGQICDGIRDLPNDGKNWFEEMSQQRSFLGEGNFYVADMLRALPAHIPIGVEVISREFQNRGLSAVEMARYAMSNTRQYFQHAPA